MLLHLELKGLGPFKEKRKFEFKPGLNVICGKNGTGKSLLMGFMGELLGSAFPIAPDPVYFPLGSYFRLKTDKGTSSVVSTTSKSCISMDFKHAEHQEQAILIFEPLLFSAQETIRKFIQTIEENPKKVLMIDSANVSEGEMKQLAVLSMKAKGLQIVISSTDEAWKKVKGVNLIEV